MSYPRPTPFELVFRQVARDVFPRVRAALEAGGHDGRDRDNFLMVGDVVGLLREFRPEEGLGEGIDQLAALIHHAYLFWSAGERAIEISTEKLTDLLSTEQPDVASDAPPASYAQFPERRVWAEVIPGRPHEPLDGCFVHTSTDTASLRVLGVFGVHPDREGFSVVEASGDRPGALARKDGTPLFAPVLLGGAAARLFSLTGEEELLELGWRIQLGAWIGQHRPRPLPSSSPLPAPSS